MIKPTNWKILTDVQILGLQYFKLIMPNNGNSNAAKFYFDLSSTTIIRVLSFTNKILKFKISNWTKSRMAKSRIGQNLKLDKISNGQNLEWTKSRFGQNPELDKIPIWTTSRMGKISNWTKSQMDKIPNWTKSWMDKILKRTKSWMDKILNGQNPEWKKFQMDKIQNRTNFKDRESQN